MVRDEDEGQDWRSVSTRALNPEELAEARQRAHEPGRGRRATDPTEIPKAGWRVILWRVFWAMPQDRVLTTAGGVAFFALLAVFPGLVAVVSIYGLFSDPHVISQHASLLADILPPGALQLFSDQLVRIAQRSTGSLSTTSGLSLLIALWSANSGVSALFDALNVIYKEREKRTLVRFYATTFLFTITSVVFFLASTSAVVLLPTILDRLGFMGATDTVLQIVRWPALLGIVTLSLSLIYRYGPSRNRAKWRWVTWGSSLAALFWVGASGVFSWYVASFDSYNRIYGSLGAGIGFMTWMWLSIVIVLVGAEINSEMERQTACDSTEGRPKPLGVREAFAADSVGASQDGDDAGSGARI
jgi:membrane protein